MMYVNPRPPLVPMRLSHELNLERYFAATAVMGILSSQFEEPDMRWVSTWSLKFGEYMAREARKRKKR